MPPCASSSTALRHHLHSVLAVVLDPLRKEDGGVLGHHGERRAQTHQGLISKRGSLWCPTHRVPLIVVNPSLSPTVGRSLHGPDGVHQEQSADFLHGLRGDRRQRGSSFPPALVSLSIPPGRGVFSYRFLTGPTTDFIASFVG